MQFAGQAVLLEEPFVLVDNQQISIVVVSELDRILTIKFFIFFLGLLLATLEKTEHCFFQTDGQQQQEQNNADDRPCGCIRLESRLNKTHPRRIRHDTDIQQTVYDHIFITTHLPAF